MADDILTQILKVIPGLNRFLYAGPATAHGISGGPGIPSTLPAAASPGQTAATGSEANAKHPIVLHRGRPEVDAETIPGAGRAPVFTDLGAVAVLPTHDDNNALNAGIVKEIPYAGAMFGALGFSLTSHENAAGISPQQMAYYQGTQREQAILLPHSGATSSAISNALNDRLLRLTEVEGRPGTKRTELIPGLADADSLTIGGWNPGGSRYGPSLQDVAAQVARDRGSVGGYSAAGSVEDYASDDAPDDADNLIFPTSDPDAFIASARPAEYYRAEASVPGQYVPAVAPMSPPIVMQPATNPIAWDSVPVSTPPVERLSVEDRPPLFNPIPRPPIYKPGPFSDVEE